MKRFLTIVAATAVAAAITIPAVADRGSARDELGTFATCLRSLGIPIPPDLEGVAIKEWVGAHQDTPGLEAAFQACDPNPPQGKPDAGAPEELLACLRNKGLEPPTDMDKLKPWILQQSETADGKAALGSCGFDGPDAEKKQPAEDGGACGAAKAQAASKAGASRAQRPKAQTTPTT
jgi:hypothetical protein